MKDTTKREWLRLPVVAAGSEYLVMGYLMRRNILTYKAPPCNEGYDLICIHPDPRHIPMAGESSKILVQVKSRYASDCNLSFPVKEVSLDAFDYLVVSFLNIGKFYGKSDGTQDYKYPEFFTLPNEFIRAHHNKKSSWQKVMLKPVWEEIQQYRNEKGFELIAKKLGIPKPTRSKE